MRGPLALVICAAVLLVLVVLIVRDVRRAYQQRQFTRAMMKDVNVTEDEPPELPPGTGGQ